MTATLEAPNDTPMAGSTPPELDHDEIERRAYFRYLDRGCADGFAFDDWVAAETEFRRETAPEPTAKP